MPACPNCLSPTGFNITGRTDTWALRRYCRHCGHKETDTQNPQGGQLKGTTPLTPSQRSSASRKGLTKRQCTYAIFDPSRLPPGTIDSICPESFVVTVVARSIKDAVRGQAEGAIAVLAKKVQELIDT